MRSSPLKTIEEYFKRAAGTDQMIIMQESSGSWLIQTRQGYFRGRTLEVAVAEAAKKLPKR